MQRFDKILQDFRNLEEDFLHKVAVSKPLIGCLCLRVPPEYIEASGAIPIRIAPRPGFDPSGCAMIRPDACSFCRSVPAILKTKTYQRLNAIIGGTCCDQMRRLMDTLGNELDIPVILFGAPRTWNAEREYFKGELKIALEKISAITGIKPDENQIADCIKVHNKLRNTIKDLRLRDRLPNSFLHGLASSPLPSEHSLMFLKIFENQPSSDSQIRILLVGSIPGVWELEIIEETGARVVADATCLGDRAFHPIVPENLPPLDALYDVYIEQNLCPHRRPVDPLIDYIRTLAEERQVDGVIYRSLKYCHPWGLLSNRIARELDMPILVVDDDFTSPAVGGFRTRAGAFVEMLKMKKRHRR